MTGNTGRVITVTAAPRVLLQAPVRPRPGRQVSYRKAVWHTLIVRQLGQLALRQYGWAHQATAATWTATEMAWAVNSGRGRDISHKKRPQVSGAEP